MRPFSHTKIKNKSRDRNKLIVFVLVIVLIAVMTLSTMAATPTYEKETSWSLTFNKVSGNSALGMVNYRSMQGIGFDTYSGKDGYVFMQSEDKKAFSLAHFSMDDDGFCTKLKKVNYKTVNVGHANDATVYKDAKGVKWLIFAPCGGFYDNNTAKAIDGSALKLGAIKLSEYNAGDAKVYSCNVSALSAVFNNSTGENKGNITGVAYKGKEYITVNNRKVKKPIFLVMNAKEIYEAYAEQSGNKLTLKPTGRSGRINKPKLLSGKDSDTQGITYHNNYVYISGEEKIGNETGTQLIVGRISLEKLFDETKQSDYKGMEVYKENNKSSSVSKHGAESIFFTSLNKKSNLYVGINRVVKGVDDDGIWRTTLRF